MLRFSAVVAFAILCVARGARADAPPFEGYGGIGIRMSSTRPAVDEMVYDDTSSVRLAAEGGVGLRFGRVMLGLHAGIATPLRFESSPWADSGEWVATTESTIYPLDLGAGAQVELTSRFWLSAWLGATVAFSFATSPAAYISAINYSGDIPAAAWSDQTIGLGFGGGLGYDVNVNAYGRFAVIVGVESQGIRSIPMRDNNGGTGSEPEDLTTVSFTLGAAYRY